MCWSEPTWQSETRGIPVWEGAHLIGPSAQSTGFIPLRCGPADSVRSDGVPFRGQRPMLPYLDLEHLDTLAEYKRRLDALGVLPEDDTLFALASAWPVEQRLTLDDVYRRKAQE